MGDKEYPQRCLNEFFCRKEEELMHGHENECYAFLRELYQCHMPISSLRKESSWYSGRIILISNRKISATTTRDQIRDIAYKIVGHGRTRYQIFVFLWCLFAVLNMYISCGVVGYLENTDIFVTQTKTNEWN